MKDAKTILEGLQGVHNLKKGDIAFDKESGNIFLGVGGVLRPSGTITITENGDHDVSQYETARVNVPTSGGASGTIQITQNGTVDVENYKYAEVNVPQPTGTIQIVANGTVNVKDYEYAEVNVAIDPVYTRTAKGEGTNASAVADSILIPIDANIADFGDYIDVSRGITLTMNHNTSGHYDCASISLPTSTIKSYFVKGQVRSDGEGGYLLDAIFMLVGEDIGAPARFQTVFVRSLVPVTVIVTPRSGTISSEYWGARILLPNSAEASVDGATLYFVPEFRTPINPKSYAYSSGGIYEALMIDAKFFMHTD